jgi:hypothetical protein
MNRPESPKLLRRNKPLAPLFITSTEQDTADPIPLSQKHGLTSLGDGELRHENKAEVMNEAKWRKRLVRMRPRCHCCSRDWVEDVLTEGTTRSYGHAIHSTCQVQLEDADKSSHLARVIEPIYHPPLHGIARQFLK